MTLGLSRSRGSERINGLMAAHPMAPAMPAKARVAENGDGPWQVRRLMLSRPKPADGKELVKREIRRRVFLEAADPELEWYVQVSVHSKNEVVFVGEVTLKTEEDEPQEELDRLVARAHRRASFLNVNCVELVGPPTISEEELLAQRRARQAADHY